MVLNLGILVDSFDVWYHMEGMATTLPSQQDRILALLGECGMMRHSEFRRAGIAPTAVSRAVDKGLVLQLRRGLYQLPGAPLDANHSLAEVTKLAPRGVVCLNSALAFHELTDVIPARVWMAIGRKDWRPRIERPVTSFLRFGPAVLTQGIEEHLIEGVSVRIYNPAKTVVDMFRYRREVGVNRAIEGLRETLRQRKARPAQIARYAADAGAWKLVQPYLEALTADA